MKKFISFTFALFILFLASNGSAGFSRHRNSAGFSPRFFGGNAYDKGAFIFPGVKKTHLVRRIEVERTDGSWLLYVDARDSHVIRYATRTMLNAFQGEGEVWKQDPITTPQRSIE